jgi:glycosyltransferase involved in cell wall biosynthesis
MGWNFVLGIGKYHELHVITEQEKWEHEIKHYLNDYPELRTNMNFHFIKKKRNRKLRKIWPPSYYYYYRQWQKKAFKYGQALHERESFDLIHQLNLAGFREPGYLWKLNIPFVWGPIGGLEITSWNLLPNLGLKGMFHFSGRNVINFIQKKYLKRPQIAAKRMYSYLLSATPENQNEILKWWGVQSEIMTEVGTKLLNINPAKRDVDEPLKIVWNGIHEPRKNLGILLKALSKKDRFNFELHVLGNGSETRKWQKQADKLGLNNNCIWYGWLSLDEVYEVYRKGHVFCLTSIHDLTSTVLMEALSFGLPIICLNHCGFSYVVNETCGIKIPVYGIKQVINDFDEALMKFYNDETLRQKLSDGALIRARDFTWEEKINRLNQIYYKLLNSNKYEEQSANRIHKDE